MIGEVLTAAGQGGLLSGNIGFPASQVAQTATEKEVLVMELSSFQLMGIEAFHPEIAVITNLMPTHIDYHGSFENYVAAKWNLQKNMTEKMSCLELQPRLGQGNSLQNQGKGPSISTVERWTVLIWKMDFSSIREKLLCVQMNWASR